MSILRGLGALGEEQSGRGGLAIWNVLPLISPVLLALLIPFACEALADGGRGRRLRRHLAVDLRRGRRGPDRGRSGGPPLLILGQPPPAASPATRKDRTGERRDGT